MLHTKNNAKATSLAKRREMLASFPGPRLFLGCMKESHRAWYLKSSDQLTSLSASKDVCISLHFTRVQQ